MTRKDLENVVDKYYEALKLPENQIKQIFGVIPDYINSTDNDFKFRYNFTSNLAFRLLVDTAEKTQESSGIWILVRGVNVDIEEKKTDRFYTFRDLETGQINMISSLEYGDFCRENTVISLDQVEFDIDTCEESFTENKKYNILRVKFFSELAELFQTTATNKFKYYQEWLPVVYDNIVKKYRNFGTTSRQK